MNIYYSNFNTVDLKHETTEGLDIETLVYTVSPLYFPQTAYYSNPCSYGPTQTD
jgi:hypothetical protein